MKIAVLLHGQPRFFSYTYNRIKEEYNLPDHSSVFFAHFWDKTGYSPSSTESDICNIESLLEAINVKEYLITDYSELDSICHSNEVIRDLAYGNIQNKKFNKKDRYHYGQYVSLLKVYGLMEKYEQENNFKFDIVIKVRTDWVYKDKSCYFSIEDYLNAKKTNYLFDDPTKKVIKSIFVKDKTINNVTYTRSFDPILITTRVAAPCFFKYWFLINYNSLIKDVITPIKEFKLHLKHDFMIGEIANFYNVRIDNIELNHGIGRAHRLVNLNDCKNFWITDDKYISVILRAPLVNVEQQIQDQLLEINKRKHK
tara:strand:- start:1772 stop:2704 length:933 start_codon:yes stop_codon:yes gene_type:complete